MQGILFAPHSLQTGSSPPQNNIESDVSMDIPHHHNPNEKPPRSTKHADTTDQSTRSDSGIFSSLPDMDPPTSSDTDSRSDCSSPDRRHYCPLCKAAFPSRHTFALHVRSHSENNKEGDDGKQERVLTDRPYVCRQCGDRFGTAGGMNRHMRTHKNEALAYESDCSSDSGKGGDRNAVEFNNNKVEVKKRGGEDVEEVVKRRKVDVEFKCPVCERGDFDSLHSFEMHFEDNHPEYPVKCCHCGLLCQNSRSLALHKNLTHSEDCYNRHQKPSVTGFKDLTFIDFSSNKFPHIARHECEKNLHKATSGLKFQCNKCGRAFPCASSLDIHQQECSMGLDLRIKDLSRPLLETTEIHREKFFASLDLQNKSPEKNGYNHQTDRLSLLNLKKSIDTSKDLADIQSIISMTTNGTLLHQLNQKPLEQQPKDQQEPTGKNEEEEAQDVFAAEFRKMKLRGEFPCRLCSAVFPNLRALKGHNRTHLSGNNNGTYRCNMCPHSSLDKAAIMRHMRTHNGDRPYECSLCNYAFTTKANCERHLRNRHAKSSREEVKKAIIYHPSEDPTNDEMNNSLGGKKPVHQILDTNELSCESRMSSSTPKQLPLLLPDVKQHHQEFREDIPDVNEIIHKENLKSLREHAKPELSFVPPYTFSPKASNVSTPSKIHVKNIEALRQEDSDSCEEEMVDQPLDLVLDLSKKKKDEEENSEVPEDLSNSTGRTFSENPVNMGDILAQRLLNNTPKIDPGSLYATLALCSGGLPIPNWPGLGLNHLLYPALQNQFLVQGQQQLRERVQRYQLCGGAMIENFAERIKTLQGINQNLNGLKLEIPQPPKQEDQKLEPNYPETILGVPQPQPVVKQDLIQSPNSVKMVIKNGVLMPKQKQRRYRTERPFSCEHCSARFTLRSNMERHIKQQHPQFWSQRQRTNLTHPGRKSQQSYPPNSGTKPYCDLTVPSYEPPKMQETISCDETKEHVNEKLRYAILANHLRGMQNNLKVPQEVVNIKKEEDEGSDLVIDENDEGKDEEPAWKIKNRNEETQDLVPVSRLLDNASQQQFKEFFRRGEQEVEGCSEEDEEGLVASTSASEGNNSGMEENRSEANPTSTQNTIKKKSAYSLAPNRVSCPYCSRKFPWTSSLRRHILTHTGQKPFKCSHCTLLFTTKSNCDRHLLRKHGNASANKEGAASAANYMMRNVPERPFKCSNCPSSTFSTYSNLKKHISCKHATGEDHPKGYETSSSEDEKGSTSVAAVEKKEYVAESNSKVDGLMQPHVQYPPNSDLPYKCHLCEKSFGERQDALDHIKENHVQEYDLLMSKNALDTSVNTPEEATKHDDEDEHEARGKFPDYSNRKVICAFCMRRFWSAEDLRRHMRTHTGERPFSCDICRRRFTLKHSMLRHRKKHGAAQSAAALHQNGCANEAESCATAVNSGDEEEPPKYGEKIVDGVVKKSDEVGDGNESGDLISNLLGLRDKSILDRVLTASADDAAKLLGVRNGGQE